MKNKKDIALIVVKETGLSQSEVNAVIDSVIEAVTREMETGESVRFYGFGTLGVKTLPPIKSRNFSNGETMDVPERKVPFFKAGDALKRRVRSS